jgi:hypothetical protein
MFPHGKERTEYRSTSECADREVRLSHFMVGEQLTRRAPAGVEQPPQRRTKRLVLLVLNKQPGDSHEG